MRALAFAALALAVTALPARAQPVLLDRIVAIVNDGVILQSELDRAIGISTSQLRDRGIATPPEGVLRTQVLDRLINNRVQTQKAQEAGIKIDDRELNEVLGNIAQQNNMTLAQFAEAVRKDGLDFLAVREQIRDEVLISRVKQQEVDSRVSVTDQDIDLFLANNKNLDDGEYRLSAILVAVPEGATPEQRQAARAKAEALKLRLDNGEDFAQLAAAESDGQQALQGGDLDWRKGSNLPTVFANVAPKLKIGEVSQPLDSAAGYHLIKLTEKRGGGESLTVTETKSQHILLQTNARHKIVGHWSIFVHSEDRSLSVLSFQMRQLCADGALRQDSGKSYTSFNTLCESRHPPVDHKCLSLTFVGVVGRHVLA